MQVKKDNSYHAKHGSVADSLQAHIQKNTPFNRGYFFGYGGLEESRTLTPCGT